MKKYACIMAKKSSYRAILYAEKMRKKLHGGMCLNKEFRAGQLTTTTTSYTNIHILQKLLIVKPDLTFDFQMKIFFFQNTNNIFQYNLSKI